MNDTTTKANSRVEAVKAYATEHYDQGWSVLVETMDDAAIAKLIEGSKSANGAIAMARKSVELWKEQLANTSSGDEAPAEAAPVGMPGHKVGCGCVGCGIARKKASGEFQPSAAVAKAKASKPAAPKVAKPKGKCACGCGQEVSSTYRPGHDARHVSLIRKAYLAGTIGRDEALGQVTSAALLSKLGRSLDLADKEIAKAAEAEVAEVSA